MVLKCCLWMCVNRCLSHTDCMERCSFQVLWDVASLCLKIKIKNVVSWGMKVRKKIPLDFKGPCPLDSYSQQMYIHLTISRIALCLSRSGGGEDPKTRECVRGVRLPPLRCRWGPRFSGLLTQLVLVVVYRLFGDSMSVPSSVSRYVATLKS
jgi:hypothetical protein